MEYEIEIKAKVKDLNVLRLKLEEIGCTFSEPIIQDDYIYNQKGIDLKDHRHNTPVLRIREQMGKIIFTVKKNRSDELDCIEKEVEVDDKNILKEIIELLGFQKTVEVHKKRQKGKYHDYEICLDEVQDLGTFIEIKKISEENGEEVKTELLNFLEKLGIKKEDRVLIGYDSQIWLKQNQK